MTEEAKPTPEPTWCIAANIINERSYGPGGAEKRSGTKHFAPGAKVYIVDFFWGMGGEDVMVVGRQRKSHRYITIIIRARWLVNWRAELVYSPHVVRELLSYGAYERDHHWLEAIWASELWRSRRSHEEKVKMASERAKNKVEEIIEGYKQWLESARTIQPPTKRLPCPQTLDDEEPTT